MRVLVLGLAAVLIVAGLIMAAVGFAARGEVATALAAERLVVQDPRVLLTYDGARAPEGVEVQKVLIDSPELAVAQAEVIQIHTLAITEGKTYSEMDREDPARATYLNAVTLRSALLQARMAFDISLLVMGLGGIFALTGLTVAGVFVLAARRIPAVEFQPQRRPANAPSAA